MKIKSEDVSDVFKADSVKRGMVFKFMYEGSPIWLKITYVNKKTGKVRAIRTTTYAPNEVDIKVEK